MSGEVLSVFCRQIIHEYPIVSYIDRLLDTCAFEVVSGSVEAGIVFNDLRGPVYQSQVSLMCRRATRS